MQSLQIPELVENAASNYAENHGITLFEFWNDALEWLFSERKKRNFFFYIASPKAKYVSLWISEKNSKAISKLALQDNVTKNRVLYTALILFLREKAYL